MVLARESTTNRVLPRKLSLDATSSPASFVRNDIVSSAPGFAFNCPFARYTRQKIVASAKAQDILPLRLELTISTNMPPQENDGRECELFRFSIKRIAVEVRA